MPRHHIRREVTGKASDILITRPHHKLKVGSDGKIHEQAEPAALAPVESTPVVEIVPPAVEEIEISLEDINEDKIEEVVVAAPVEDTPPVKEPKKTKRRSSRKKKKKKGD